MTVYGEYQYRDELLGRFKKRTFPLYRASYRNGLGVMQNGKKTAEINYGCRGFACNHNVDLWRKTPPVKGDANYMFSPLCGTWLANEIYTHFKNGELDEYKEKVREIVTESALFLNDFLVLHEGEYVICPSVSPENVFASNNKNCKLDFASAYDMGLVRQCFENALEISDDENLKSDINKKLPLLFSFKEGKSGKSGRQQLVSRHCYLYNLLAFRYFRR